MGDDLSEMLASIDPAVLGRRIKQARIAAEMTQTQLAAADASVAYVSRIETGQRRPDMKLLQAMARRLRTTPLALISGAPDPTLDRIRVALDHADLSLRGGSAHEAGRQLEEIWDEVDRVNALDLRRRWRYLRALTWESCGHLDDAIVALEDLLAEGADALEATKCAIALSRCYRESGDLARAIEAGEACLDVLRAQQLEGTDEGAQLAVTVAAAHFTRGDVAHAVRMCRRAIERAEEVGSPVAMASAYWNASIMESERGDSRSAVSLAERALHLLEAAESNRNVARLRAELGIFQLRLDPPEIDAAQENFAAAAMQFDWSNASPADRGRNKVAHARAKLMSGLPEEAFNDAAAVLAEIQGSAPIVAAGALLVMGQASMERGDLDSATAHYRQAAAVLTGSNLDRSASECWVELASLFEELGLEGEANKAYRSATAAAGLVSMYTPRERRRSL